MPAFWEARAIETINRQGRKRILLTSMMNARIYPAQEVVKQYPERWRIETSYCGLKQSMLGDDLTLRSGSPDTVRQEVWGALLAYNLIRLEMAAVAKEAGVAATDLSFITALHYLRTEWMWLAITTPGKLPSNLQRLRIRLGELLLPKQRRGRTCPHVVKKLPSRYPTKQVRSAK